MRILHSFYETGEEFPQAEAPLAGLYSRAAGVRSEVKMEGGGIACPGQTIPVYSARTHLGSRREKGRAFQWLEKYWEEDSRSPNFEVEPGGTPFAPTPTSKTFCVA